MKVAMKELKDIDKISLDQLVGSLRGYEMDMMEKDPKFMPKVKDLGFVAKTDPVIETYSSPVKAESGLIIPTSSLHEKVDRIYEVVTKLYEGSKISSKKKSVKCLACEGHGHEASS